MSTISRRGFIGVGAAAGAGLVIAFYYRHGGSTSATFAPNAYLQITPDEKITVVVARSEMGQGVRTSLPMILAEELDVDLNQITIEQAGASTLYGSQATGGSASVHTTWDPMRKAGAQAREMLIGAAAREWGVHASQCSARSGAVWQTGSNRTLSYGALVAKAATLPVPADPPLKKAGEYKLVGTPAHRLDTPSKVRGAAEFGIDFRLPGMKYGLLARCPVIGGKVASFDDKETKLAPGVSFVGKIGDSAVAVVADTVWGAMEGRRLLNVTWDEGANKDLSSAGIMDTLKKAVLQKGVQIYGAGDVSKIVGRRVEGTYETPLMAHAPMEPGNSVASFQATGCEVWAPAQDPQDCQAAIASALGIDAKQVKVNLTLLGGGFGRRLEHDYAVEAALVSKAIQGPVKVLWTREDDMRNSPYRPSTFHKLSGVMDAEGWPVALTHHLVAPSINLQKGTALEDGVDVDMKDETSMIYGVPNALVEFIRVETPIPIGFMRSVYALDSAFAVECFIDEMAAAGKKDPLEYRLKLLEKDQDIKFFETVWQTRRMRGVLQMAAEKAAWGKPLPAGHYQGIACFGCFSTYMAEVVEISMENDKPHVHRVVGAIDCGQVINPNILEQQIQGGVIYALTNALRAKITIEKGRVVQGNFDDYEPLRMNEIPAVEAYFVPSTEAPTGAGEPPVPPVAPALCNAIYAATKRRIRGLPILG
jgi:isoquinoline 1-oxidoreductase subunit beta